jgi:hypothetical protein
MKIFEIFSNPSDEAFTPNFDIGDDLVYFVNNDPQFYRKHYFPFIVKVKEARQNKTKFSSKAFESLVKHAYSTYKQTFQEEPNLPTNLDEELIKEICEKLYEIELKNIDEGQYDDLK